ncbi:threonine ammonia-lyase [Nocardioides sambongensis]|uniref:threonine ammonia-lyase n=1 Tax=Nocardioides sambongensis TaxID=2589074 RepID=UPI0011286B0A|nr:pyridoxal-phosphate dependent enzyme [Nocardioides sambongensis]
MDSSVGTSSLTFAAVQRAGEVVAATLATTPLVSHPVLDRSVGRRLLVKHEHVLPTGSFKVRGGVHLAATLTDVERRVGLVTTSTGNHAQSVAFAARAAGVPATVVMPQCAPAVKRDAVEALGARVIVHGDGLGEAAAHARSLATEGGYIDPTDPRIILGHATAYLELFTQASGLGAVYVPIGSGTGAVGACVVRDALAPSCAVIGVQSSSAPAGWRSWLSGRIETAPAATRASGLATTSGYAATLATLWAGLADFLLVTDDEIDGAARLLATRAGTLAEGAGAAALAGVVAAAEPAADGDLPVADGELPVAVMCTGGNASADEIARLAAAA